MGALAEQGAGRVRCADLERDNGRFQVAMLIVFSPRLQPVGMIPRGGCVVGRITAVAQQHEQRQAEGF